MQDVFTVIQQIIDIVLWSPGSGDPNIHYAIGAAVIPLITLALSAASGGYSMIKQNEASDATRAAMDEQNRKMTDLSSWYNAEASKDFMDTEVAKSTVGKIREQYKKGVETNASDAARGGATAEAEVANKAALNEKYNNVMNNMVGYGTEYKQSLKKDYGNSLSSLAQGQNTANMMDVNSRSNQTSNSWDAFANTAGSTDWEAIFGS